MILVHTTTERAWDSIQEEGILCSYSRGKRAAIWFHSPSMNQWGETHCRMKHDAQCEDIIHLYCNCEGLPLVRHSRGLYYCEEDCLPERFLEALRVVVNLVPVPLTKGEPA